MSDAKTATMSSIVTVNGTLYLGSVATSGGQLISCSSYLRLGNGANIVVSNTAVAGSLDSAPNAFGTTVNIT